MNDVQYLKRIFSHGRNQAVVPYPDAILHGIMGILELLEIGMKQFRLISVFGQFQQYASPELRVEFPQLAGRALRENDLERTCHLAGQLSLRLRKQLL